MRQSFLRFSASSSITTLGTLTKIKVNNITQQFFKHPHFKFWSYGLVLDWLLGVVSTAVWQHGIVSWKILRIWSEFNVAVYNKVIKDLVLASLTLLSSFILSLIWRTDSNSSKWFLNKHWMLLHLVHQRNSPDTFLCDATGYSLLVATWKERGTFRWPHG